MTRLGHARLLSFTALVVESWVLPFERLPTEPFLFDIVSSPGTGLIFLATTTVRSNQPPSLNQDTRGLGAMLPSQSCLCHFHTIRIDGGFS